MDDGEAVAYPAWLVDGDVMVARPNREARAAAGHLTAYGHGRIGFGSGEHLLGRHRPLGRLGGAAATEHAAADSRGDGRHSASGEAGRQA